MGFHSSKESWEVDGRNNRWVWRMLVVRSVSHEEPAVEVCRLRGKHMCDTAADAIRNETVFEAAPLAQAG